MGNWNRAADCALTVLVVAMAPAIPSWADPLSHSSAGASRNGCEGGRLAVAHRAGGAPVTSSDHGRKAPVACSTPTGWRSNEIGIAVTKAGTVVLAPAYPEAGFPIGIIRSTDKGRSWSSVVPSGDGPVLDSFDGNVGIDRRTGRVFWITPGYFLTSLADTARMAFSDDDGQTWSKGGHPVMRLASGNADSMKIFAGPPTKKSAHLLRSYPTVVYNCGGHKPQRCQKSLDGGLTWGPPSDLPFPPELAPIQGSANDCSNFGLNGVVGKDGTVYFGYTPCNRPYVAISHDETETWETVRIADVETIGWGMSGVALDDAGNLYAAWVAAADRLPYLSISRDRGRRWSTPMMIGAPGVNEAAIPKVVAGKPGQVAVAYYGSKNSPGPPFPTTCPGLLPAKCPGYEEETWSTYVTETFNALKAQPLFWSAPLNDPSLPIWYGCTPSSTGVIRLDESNPFQRGPGNLSSCQSASDYFGMDMAPDGTPWVGFQQYCPGGLPVPGNPNCPATLNGGPSMLLIGPTGKYWSLVGRMVGATGDAEDED